MCTEPVRYKYTVSRNRQRFEQQRSVRRKKAWFHLPRYRSIAKNVKLLRILAGSMLGRAGSSAGQHPPKAAAHCGPAVRGQLTFMHGVSYCTS